MKKIVIITGLTGSGKSALALKLCKDYSGEIISADSVQIYKGLDIGSAKATREEMSNVSHHLIDIFDFNQTFNVSEFVSKCDDALKEIINRGHIPFPCPFRRQAQEKYPQAPADKWSIRP